MLQTVEVRNWVRRIFLSCSLSCWCLSCQAQTSRVEELKADKNGAIKPLSSALTEALVGLKHKFIALIRVRRFLRSCRQIQSDAALSRQLWTHSFSRNPFVHWSTGESCSYDVISKTLSAVLCARVVVLFPEQYICQLICKEALTSFCVTVGEAESRREQVLLQTAQQVSLSWHVYLSWDIPATSWSASVSDPLFSEVRLSCLQLSLLQVKCSDVMAWPSRHVSICRQ